MCSSLPCQEHQGTSSCSSCFFMLTVAGRTSYVGLHSLSQFKWGREWRSAIKSWVWVLLICCGVQMLLQVCWRYPEKGVLRATNAGLCSMLFQQKPVSLSKTEGEPLSRMLLWHPRSRYSPSAAVHNTCSAFSKIFYGQVQQTVFRKPKWEDDRVRQLCAFASPIAWLSVSLGILKAKTQALCAST